MLISFFNRDVNCIRRFFRRRFHFEGTSWPLWKDVLAEIKESSERPRIDLEVEASGFGLELQQQLEDVSCWLIGAHAVHEQRAGFA